MAQRRTGITADTYQRLLTDSGVVVVDYGLASERKVGATRGGNSFGVEQENREMLADGAPGPVKGSQRRLRSIAKLTVNILEMTKENVQMSLPGSTSALESGYDKITREDGITLGDYYENVALIITKNGGTDPMVFMIKNALALENAEFEASEDDEPVLSVELTAHFDPDNIGAEPWEIWNPEDQAFVYYDVTYGADANGTVVGDTTQSVRSGEDATEVGAIPDTGYVFDEWDDGSTDNPRKDTNVTEDIDVTATFVQES